MDYLPTKIEADLDKRFCVDQPQTFIIQAQGDSPQLGIKSGDKLIIDRELIPGEGDLVILVMKNRFVIDFYSEIQLQDENPETGDFLWGVVIALLRELR